MKKLSAEPVLLFNTGQEDREVCDLVMSSSMLCEFFATKDKKLSN